MRSEIKNKYCNGLDKRIDSQILFWLPRMDCYAETAQNGLLRKKTRRSCQSEPFRPNSLLRKKYKKLTHKKTEAKIIFCLPRTVCYAETAQIGLLRKKTESNAKKRGQKNSAQNGLQRTADCYASGPLYSNLERDIVTPICYRPKSRNSWFGVSIIWCHYYQNTPFCFVFLL